MTAKKNTKRAFRFTLTISGYVDGTTLESADEALDHAINDADLKSRGITVVRRVVETEV